MAGEAHSEVIASGVDVNGSIRHLKLDATGALVTAGGGSGGGAATIADGADVAEGATTDVAWVGSGAGSLVAISKAEYAKLEAIRALLAGSIAVTGTFWQATQPVSLAAAVDVSDRAARLLGHVTVDNASLAVTGPLTDAQLRATRVPVDASGVAVPVTDNAGSLTVDGSVTALQGTAAAVASAWPTKVTDGTNVGAVKAASAIAAAADPAQVVQQSPQRADASTLWVTATGAAAAAATATLPAAGAGLFHYITSIQIVKFATALLTAGAAPVLVTTTNLPGSPVFSFSAAASAAGTDEVQTITPATPIKSSVANTATTIVGPATTATIWRINVTYYTAP